MNWIDILSVVVALGASLIGGTFLAFSNFVMPGIARQPPPSGIATMNAINVTVLNAGFLGAFMGTAILGLALVLAVLVAGGSPWAAAGALIYVIGTFGVTMAISVPMNNRLAKFEAEVHKARPIGRATSGTGCAGIRSAAALRCSQRSCC